MRTFALLFVCAAIVAADPSAPRQDGADPALRRAVAAHPDRLHRALVKLQPGQPLPQISGITFGRHRGSIVTASGPASALASLALQVPRVELARPARPLNDVSTASTIGFHGSISPATDVDPYTFAGAAGQTVRICVHSEGTLDPFLSVTEAGPAVTDDNSGPGNDAELTVTWSSSGAKMIDVSSGSSGTTGGYLLTITASTPISTGDLTGGDVGVDAPHFAGTRAREARAQEGVDGSGILIGFVDTGIDINHTDFKRPDGSTRLVGIWDQTLTAVAGESVPGAGYGVYYDEEEVNTPGFVRQKDTDGHGTHVAGIASGGDPVFTGAAPGARLLMVKFDGTTTGILDGVNLILDEAEKLGFDAVAINLSVGTHDGPHDGSSLLDQAVSALPARGQAVVCAAGNEGSPLTSVIHANATVSSPVTWTFTPTSVSIVDVDPPHALDLWADGADRYSVTATDGVNSLTTASGATGTLGPTIAGVQVTIENRVDAPSNGATHMRIEINSPALLPSWSITLTRTSSAGTGVVDGYVASESGSFAPGDITPNVDGSVPGTVSEPGTAVNAITVGAFRGKFTWDTGSGTTDKLDGIGPSVAGNIAAFSSRGPTRDGRMKPDIAAPGAWIGSSRSADASPLAENIDADSIHSYNSGTSMAAPQVAGILALLFQKNRLLTNDELKATLASTALADGFTAAGSTWGAGKVNATGLLASVITEVDIQAHGGGCAGAATGVPAGGVLAMVCLSAAFIALLIGRRP